MPAQSYMGLVKEPSAGGNIWQMDRELGGDEDDGTFMEASPMEDSQADEEDTSFPAAKTVSTGAHSCKASNRAGTVATTLLCL